MLPYQLGCVQFAGVVLSYVIPVAGAAVPAWVCAVCRSGAVCRFSVSRGRRTHQGQTHQTISVLRYNFCKQFYIKSNKRRGSHAGLVWRVSLDLDSVMSASANTWTCPEYRIHQQINGPALSIEYIILYMDLP